MTNSLITAIAASLLAVSASVALAEEAPAIDPMAAEAGVYESDPYHAYITFAYVHQGYSKPYLRWREWSGELDWDPKKPTKSKLSVEINAASIDSGIDKFDDHLRGADFFDVENHPKITFVSTKLEKTGETTGILTGDLTVKGETKPVALDVTLNRAADDDFAKAHKLGFSATGKIKRTEFGVGKYAPFVGDDVDLIIEVEFVKPRG